MKKECEQFVGRLRDLCEGRGQDGRPDPNPKFVDAFRKQHGLSILDPSEKAENFEEEGQDFNTLVSVIEANHPFNFDDPSGFSNLYQNSATSLITPHRNTGNAGTKLKEIFKELKVELPVCAPCQDAVLKMDRLLPAECRYHKNEFMTGIRERAKEVTTLAYIKAAARAVTTGLALHIDPRDPLSSLYDLAVQRAEEELQNGGKN